MRQINDRNTASGASAGLAYGVTPLNFAEKAKDFVRRNGSDWFAPERGSAAWLDWMAYFRWLDDQIIPHGNWVWTATNATGMTVPAPAPRATSAEAFEARTPTAVTRSRHAAPPSHSRPVGAAKVLDNGYVVSPEERERVIAGFAALKARLAGKGEAVPDARRAATPEERERAEAFHAARLETIAADLRAGPDALKLSTEALAIFSREPGDAAPPPPEAPSSERERLLHGPGELLQKYFDEFADEADYWRSLGESIR